MKHTLLYRNRFRGRRCRECMVVDLQLPLQSVPIITDVVSSNLDQGEVYNSLSVTCDRLVVFSGSTSLISSLVSSNSS
jgi:hypothetical protein